MTIPQQQNDVAAFLQNLTGRAPVETHISAVFVGPHDVYKLKKAVRLPFLDFSAVATRGAMTRREVALNRVAAPGIYRGVRAIVRGVDGALALAPEDAPDAVEYVVHMAPIPPGDFFDEIVARGKLTSALLDGLGDCVVDLHAHLPCIEGWDSPGGLRGIIEGNADAALHAGLPADAVAQWQRGVLGALDRIAPVLRARAAACCVRRLHGDLHLGNICLWQGVPTAFDMLEFDDALATGDVGYDLAFLLMDLEVRAGRAAANRVLNRYIARTGDVGVLAALPCFVAIRAMVRAHVQMSRQQSDDAARYLRASLGALHGQMPVLVAIGGLQGTGKSTLARALAPTLGRAPGAVVLRSDETRKRLFNALPEEKLAPVCYGAGANARVNTALLADVATALQGGQAVVADGTFLHEPLRRGIEAAARSAGVPFVGLWLEADLDTLVQRVGARQGDASDAGPDIVRVAAAVEPGRITWHRLTSDDAAATLALAREKLPVG
jgi:aminoglycoside phosphotransferase family enzyme/predicted kinase